MTQYVRNILKLYRQASNDDTINGVEWYARAERVAAQIADTHKLPVNTVIGVMAALSPNNRWERNCKDTDTMCTAWQSGDSLDDFKVSCYNTMKQKAWSILQDDLIDDDDILTRLNGQKIRSFYSNIRGLDEVTIDGHALNIARGQREGLTSDKTNMGKRQYRELQVAYVKAAKRVKVKPHVLQAITWTTWKRVHNIKIKKDTRTMEQLEMYLPSHWLTAIFNDDKSGFTDEDQEQYNAFIKDMNSQHCDWHELDCTDEPHFMTYHNARQYGVLACNVVAVTFALPEQG